MNDYELGVVAWATDRDYIEKRMALRETATVHHRRGYKVKLLALAGHELFKQVGVEDLGYEIVDCSAYFDEISAKYCNLRNVFKGDNRGNFFFNNTLRWMVLKKFLHGKPVNVDGDLIINNGAIEHLRSKKCDFFYPDSTCFVITNDSFFESYIETVDFIQRDADKALAYMANYAVKNSLSHWGLNALKRVEDLDEEKIAAFAIHRAGLYRFDAKSAPLLACPPFIAHAYGGPPFGRYLARYQEKFASGASYEYLGDTHYLAGFPFCFIHYQEQLHFLLGAHAVLDSLTAADHIYKALPPKSFLIQYVFSEAKEEYDEIKRFIWNMAINKPFYKHDFWDMRRIVSGCENGELAKVFNKVRWHYDNVFTS